MTLQEKAVNAVRAQLEILITIHTFEKLGFIVEPDSTKHHPMSIAKHLYNALTSNADLIHDILNITKTEDQELFDARLLEFAEKFTEHPFKTNVIVEKFLFGYHYAELRNNYTDEDENEVYIDAWKTDNDSEEGTVIAKVNTKTYNVTYLDAAAITDPEAQELIQDTIKELQTT